MFHFNFVSHFVCYGKVLLTFASPPSSMVYALLPRLYALPPETRRIANLRSLEVSVFDFHEATGLNPSNVL